MKPRISLILSLIVLVCLSWYSCGPANQVSAQEETPERAVMRAGAGSQSSHLLGTSGYVFTSLKDERFLRSDGSAAVLISNQLHNTGPESMARHGWCFYWGRDLYSRVFAKDAQGYLHVDYYEDYSSDYQAWGYCVDVQLRQAVPSGGDVFYALGITIADHHGVVNDVITAGWSVRSSSSVQTYTARVSWPFNHEGVTADPRPDILQSDYAQWTRTSAQAPWQFTVNLSVTLGDQMAVEPLSQGTSPFNGADIPWEDDPYGVNSGHTIGAWGCYLTSGTMAINYYARLRGFFDQTDPGEVNTWLATPAVPGSPVPRGYARASDSPPGSYSLVDSSRFGAASADLFDASGALIVPGELESVRTVDDMRDNLQNGQLGILNVSNGGYGHFVLVTGYRTDGGTTVSINDPDGNRGGTTLLQQYNNQHLGSVRWFSAGGQTVRPNYVTLYANCPVELIVTDQVGRRTGYDPRSGRRYNEIPSSAYVTEHYPGHLVAGDEGTKILQIESYEPSSYRVDVIGTGSGSYMIDYTAELSSGAVTRSSFSGSTTRDEVDTEYVNYDPDTGIGRQLFLPLLRR